jgi:uncharacterized protein (TIGR02246 family)
MEDDKKSIQEFYVRWFDALTKGDAEKLIDLFEDEFYFKIPNHEVVKDKNVLLNLLHEFNSNYREKVDWKIDEILLIENKAFVRISENATIVSKNENESMHLSGVHSAILIKKNNSTWKLKSDVSSVNHYESRR